MFFLFGDLTTFFALRMIAYKKLTKLLGLRSVISASILLDLSRDLFAIVELYLKIFNIFT